MTPPESSDVRQALPVLERLARLEAGQEVLMEALALILAQMGDGQIDKERWLRRFLARRTQREVALMAEAAAQARALAGDSASPSQTNGKPPPPTPSP